MPDLLICCNGFFIGAEIKAPDGKTSELQEWNIRKIKEAGGIAVVVYPDDYEKFTKLVKFLKTYDSIESDVVF